MFFYWSRRTYLLPESTKFVKNFYCHNNRWKNNTPVYYGKVFFCTGNNVLKFYPIKANLIEVLCGFPSSVQPNALILPEMKLIPSPCTSSPVCIVRLVGLLWERSNRSGFLRMEFYFLYCGCVLNYRYFLDWYVAYKFQNNSHSNSSVLRGLL